MISMVSSCYCGILSPEVSLLSYMGNAGGFESEVSIHWFLEGRLLRQSGGQIPKGAGRCFAALESRQLINLVRQDLACSWTALAN